MAMKHCPDCGEKYSDTYKSCPFCEEERALQEGRPIRRRRAAQGSKSKRSFSLITPTLIVLIIIMAALLIYLLYGDKMKRKDDMPEKPGTEEVTPGVPVEQQPDPEQAEDPEVVMPEDPGTETEPEPTTPADPVTPQQPEQTEEPADKAYEDAMKLSSGLSLSTEDFTLRTLGETSTIRVSGGSGSYKWISQDPGVATVDQNGKVTAISGGTVNVVVTDGSRKGVCIVRVSASGTLTPSTGGESSSAGLHAGAAMVINGGNGVRVRSGPGTNYDILATVPNGADIQVMESVGNDWYKIKFDNIGGVSTTGYMKGEFLKNK